MGYSEEYQEYLQSDTWKRKRRRVIKRAGNRCEKCGLELPLDVHHLTYDRLGHEKMSDLKALCRSCHDEEHQPMSWIMGICKTCGETLLLFREWLEDGWTRWTCADGHINEKRGRHE